MAPCTRRLLLTVLSLALLGVPAHLLSGCGGIAAPAVERLVLFSATDVQFEETANAPGGILTNVGLGGTRLIVGAETGGSLLLLTNIAQTQAWIRDMATGTDTAFAPSALGFSGTMCRAAIHGPTGRVYWLRNSGANREVVASNLDGSGETLLYLPAPAPARPVGVAVSPDGANLALVLESGFLRRIPTDVGGWIPIADGTSLGATSAVWLDNATLAVAFMDCMGTGKPGISRIFPNGDPQQALFDAAGAGLRSAPRWMAVDSGGNVLFDELDIALSQHEIYRTDAPAYAARVGMVVRPQDDGWPLLLRW